MKRPIVLLWIISCVPCTYSKGCEFQDRLLDWKLSVGAKQVTGSDYVLFDEHTTGLWENHEVPFVFDNAVKEDQKPAFRNAMKKYEDNTCIRFKEYTRNVPAHHLYIWTEDWSDFPENADLHTPNCDINYGNNADGQVYWDDDPRASKRVYLRIEYKTKAGISCPKEDEELILHELGHIFGMRHTQRRPDFNKYIKINWDCVDSTSEGNFKTVDSYKSFTCGFPYQCNSIMHYKSNWGKNYTPECRNMDVIESINPSQCPEVGFTNKPTKQDWDFINLIEQCDERRCDKSLKPLQ